MMRATDRVSFTNELTNRKATRGEAEKYCVSDSEHHSN